jgi:hypothetical protein
MLDHTQPASFGSVEIGPREPHEWVGQETLKTDDVAMVAIDSMRLTRCDLIKLDVEGMELDALAGAAETIAALHPVLFVERVKVDEDGLAAWLDGQGYRTRFAIGLSWLAIHDGDPILGSVRMA